LRGTAYSRSPPGHDITAGTRDRRADLSEHAIEPPLVTIGVVSYNRLLYLRAMLESARECVEYPNLQWVVVDSGSTEPGLREYLEGIGFLDELEFLEQPFPAGPGRTFTAIYQRPPVARAYWRR